MADTLMVKILVTIGVSFLGENAETGEDFI